MEPQAIAPQVQPPIMTEPAASTSSPVKKILTVVGILAALGLAYAGYAYLSTPTVAPSDVPPSLTLPTSGLKGNITDVDTMIGFMVAMPGEVYTPPVGVTPTELLPSNVSLWDSGAAGTTFGTVAKAIDLVKSQKALIAYYDPIAKEFATYPVGPFPGTKLAKLEDKIPGSFIVISRAKSLIYGFSGVTTIATTPIAIDPAVEGWVLVRANDTSVSKAVAPISDRITDIYALKDATTFEKVANTAVLKDFYMLWVKVKKGTATDTKPTITENGIESTQLIFKGTNLNLDPAATIACTDIKDKTKDAKLIWTLDKTSTDKSLIFNETYADINAKVNKDFTCVLNMKDLDLATNSKASLLYVLNQVGNIVFKTSPNNPFPIAIPDALEVTVDILKNKGLAFAALDPNNESFNQGTDSKYYMSYVWELKAANAKPTDAPLWAVGPTYDASKINGLPDSCLTKFNGKESIFMTCPSGTIPKSFFANITPGNYIFKGTVSDGKNTATSTATITVTDASAVTKPTITTSSLESATKNKVKMTFKGTDLDKDPDATITCTDFKDANLTWMLDKTVSTSTQIVFNGKYADVNAAKELTCTLSMKNLDSTNKLISFTYTPTTNDVQRLVDLNAMKFGMDNFFTKNKKYPTDALGYVIPPEAANFATPSGSSTPVVNDPIGKPYYYRNINNSCYVLGAVMEVATNGNTGVGGATDPGKVIVDNIKNYDCTNSPAGLKDNSGIVYLLFTNAPTAPAPVVTNVVVTPTPASPGQTFSIVLTGTNLKGGIITQDAAGVTDLSFMPATEIEGETSITRKGYVEASAKPGSRGIIVTTAKGGASMPFSNAITIKDTSIDPATIKVTSFEPLESLNSLLIAPGKDFAFTVKGTNMDAITSANLTVTDPPPYPLVIKVLDKNTIYVTGKTLPAEKYQKAHFVLQYKDTKVYDKVLIIGNDENWTSAIVKPLAITPEFEFNIEMKATAGDYFNKVVSAKLKYKDGGELKDIKVKPGVDTKHIILTGTLPANVTPQSADVILQSMNGDLSDASDSPEIAIKSNADYMTDYAKIVKSNLTVLLEGDTGKIKNDPADKLYFIGNITIGAKSDETNLTSNLIMKKMSSVETLAGNPSITTTVVNPVANGGYVDYTFLYYSGNVEVDKPILGEDFDINTDGKVVKSPVQFINSFNGYSKVSINLDFTVSLTDNKSKKVLSQNIQKVITLDPLKLNNLKVYAI